MRGVVFNLGGEGGNMAQLIFFFFFLFVSFHYLFSTICVF